MIHGGIGEPLTDAVTSLSSRKPASGSDAVRARLAVLTPDLARGVRAAIATVVPFYLTGALHRPELAWVAIGGWLGSLADPGGARRIRALAVLAVAVLGGAAIAIGAVSAATTATAALALGAIVLAASFAAALGATARSVGTIIAIAGGIAAARPTDPRAAALFAAGVAWAALTSTIAWPLWPHLPVRLAVGRVFERLAEYVEAIAAAGPADWPELARRHQRAVRAAIEEARATTLALRARRAGESPAGANLRVLLGAAEGVFFQVIALAEDVERGGAVPPRLAAALRAIARDLFTRRAGPPAALAGGTPLADATLEIAALAGDLDRVPGISAGTAPRARWSLRALRDALSPSGPILQHAVRASVLAAVAIAIGRTLTPAQPTWVPMSAIAVLQPQLGSTLVRALERVAGTIFGAALAFALMTAIHAPLARALLMVLLAAAAVVTRPRSYRLFVLFLTPVFVMVADLDHGDWHTAVARVVDVALGGGLALVAAFIVPSRERPRLADAIDGVLASLARYVAMSAGGHEREQIVAMRRELGLALEGAEASLERMLAEPPPLRHGEERAMYVVTYARRLGASITELLESGGAVPADVAAYLARAIAEARCRADADAAAEAPVTPPPPVPAGPGAVELLVRRGELLARTARLAAG
jgi:uncharacterized membrane protein YccC